jgi:hypothetical protein
MLVAGNLLEDDLRLSEVKGKYGIDSIVFNQN